MESFVIEGGQPLKGSITPQGAKNEALQILCAVLLTSEEINIHNIPDIVDVNKLIQLLKNFGVKVEKISILTTSILSRQSRLLREPTKALTRSGGSTVLVRLLPLTLTWCLTTRKRSGTTALWHAPHG